MMAATQLWPPGLSEIRPPEIFALVFFGLAVASSVGGRTIWKGWLSVLLDLMIATIGQDPVGGINRYNFGFADLAAGIAFVPAILLLPYLKFSCRRKSGQGTFLPRKWVCPFPLCLNYRRKNCGCAVNSCWVFLRDSAWHRGNVGGLYGLWRSGEMVKDKESFGKGNMKG